ncbi:glycosyltransferase [soil metagenome]
MRILFFIDSLTAGGKERRLTQLMRSLQNEKDIQFELVVMSNSVHYKEIFDWNIKVHYLIRKTKKDRSVFRKFYHICKTFKPDIIHCWDSMTVVYALPAWKLLKVKLVNGMVVDTPSRQSIFNKHWVRGKLIIPFGDIVIGNSRAGLAAYGAAPKKSVCIYNGMDLARFQQLKEPAAVRREIFGESAEGLFVAGMVAAFEDRKDYKTLIRAATSLVTVNDRIRFILVGGGVNFDEIKNSVPPLLQRKIILLGKRSDIESIVNIFDTGILLTNTKVHGEGISNSIIEYMALRKPVIATRGGGTNEVVIDNENGYLIDADSDDQLKQKIEILVGNKDLANELGKKGRQMVEKKFDIKIMAKKYIDTYHQLLKKS